MQRTPGNAPAMPIEPCNHARQTAPSRLRYLCWLLAGQAIVAFGATTAPAADPPGRQLVGTVIRVTSGDTIYVAARGRRYKLRLEAIAAPGAEHAAFEPARQALSAMTLGREVRIDALRETGTLEWTGRVWVDSKSINKQMLDEGWARYVEGEQRYPVLARSEAEARQAQRGMWRDPQQAQDADHNRPMPGREDNRVMADARPDDTASPSPDSNAPVAGAGDAIELPQFANYVPRSIPRDEGERRLHELLEAVAQKQQEVAGPLDGDKIDEQLASLAEVDFGAIFGPQLLRLSAEHRASEAAPWALLLVAQYESGNSPESAERLQQAYRELAAHHADSTPVGHALLALRHKPDAVVDKGQIYRQVIETSTQREARAVACYLWAASLEKDEPDEARRLWQRAVAELGDVKFGRQKLAAIAKKHLAKLDEADGDAGDAEGQDDVPNTAAPSAAEATPRGDADELADNE